MSIYKLISYKHSPEGEVISVGISRTAPCSPLYREEETFIEELSTEEKDKLLVSLIGEINSLKEELDDLKGTLRNYNIIGD